MAKLSEIFKTQIKSDSYNYEAKYNQSDGTESVDFKEGANYTLDNLTPKICLAFGKYLLSDECEIFVTKQEELDRLGEKLFQEFLKDYKA